VDILKRANDTPGDTPGVRLLMLLLAVSRALKPTARFVTVMEQVEAGAPAALRCLALLRSGQMILGGGNPRGGGVGRAGHSKGSRAHTSEAGRARAAKRKYPSALAKLPSSTQLLVKLRAVEPRTRNPTARYGASLELVEAGVEGALHCLALLRSGQMILGGGRPPGGVEGTEGRKRARKGGGAAAQRCPRAPRAAAPPAPQTLAAYLDAPKNVAVRGLLLARGAVIARGAGNGELALTEDAPVVLTKEEEATVAAADLVVLFHFRAIC
jgi:hypothetical protein